MDSSNEVVMIKELTGHIRKTRQKLNISQREAACKVGLSHEFYKKVEKGQVFPNQKNVQSIAQTLMELKLELKMKTDSEKIDGRKKSLNLKYVYTAGSVRFNIFGFGELLLSPSAISKIINVVGEDKVLNYKESSVRSLFEAWVTALFCLGPPVSEWRKKGLEPYIRCIEAECPDTEIVMVNTDSLLPEKTIQIEVAIHSKKANYDNIEELLAKKLVKGYEEATILIIYIEKQATLKAARLRDFLVNNNIYNRKIWFVGDCKDKDKDAFKVVHYMPTDQYPAIILPESEESVFFTHTFYKHSLNDIQNRWQGIATTGLMPKSFPIFIENVEFDEQL